MRKSAIVKLVAFGFTLSLVPLLNGCSEDSTTAPPAIVQDTAAPAPPVGIEIQRRDAGVRLTWVPNLESDLAGYNVWLYQPSPEAVQAYTKINTSLLTNNRFGSINLPNVGPDYYFRLTAVDETGNESAFSSVVRSEMPYWISE